MSIESEIKKGHFVVGQCTKCKKVVWPPSDFCNKCFGEVSIKEGPQEGSIIEYSVKNGVYFCLAEFEKNVRIMGKITDGVPKRNQKVGIKKCGSTENGFFFEFSLIS